MSAVELVHLTKVFPGGVTACADVSLAVEAGERVVLLGPSGCGKTTILRLIAGLETPTTGRVRLGGADAAGLPPHRRGVALLAQRPVLYPHLRVRDNLRFGLPRSADTDRRVADAVGLLHLGDLLDRRPGQLSGGQQQRAALAKAIVRDPAVLLLDEPLGSLDGPLRWELRQELDLLWRRLRVTMIYVTHEQEEALSLADRLAVLDHGRLLQHGPPVDVHDRPASVTVARLLGWPPINLLPGQVRPAGFETDGLLLPLPAACDGWRRHAGLPVLAGIRPHQVRAGDDPAKAPAAVGLAMTVARVEPAGDAWNVFLGRGRLALLGRWAHPPAAAEVDVAVDLASAHLFDAATGLALLHPYGPQAG